jgi:glycosyltransferase involved in cell wall biosynthesis
VILEMINENEDFARDVKLVFVGRTDNAVQESIRKFQLEGYVEKLDFMPHEEVIRMQRKSQVLLLLINQTQNSGGILTGKFFEYLAAKRPVAAIGPVKGDVAEILRESSSGAIVDFNDKEGLKSLLIEYYTKFKTNQLHVDPVGINIYSRYELTRKLSKLMEELLIEY